MQNLQSLLQNSQDFPPLEPSLELHWESPLESPLESHLEPCVEPLKHPQGWTGLVFAIVCLLGWFLSLIFCLQFDFFGFPDFSSVQGLPGFLDLPSIQSLEKSLEILAAIGLRTFLQTGLFILAHDAMHQSLFPHHLGLNHRLGSIALWCYGGLDYQQCCQSHYHHHRHPGSDRDSDLSGKNAQILTWYFRFLSNYLSLKLFLKIIVNLGVLFLLAQGSPLSLSQDFWNLGLFYLLPLILSSWQLFIFGTYLPHRPIPGEPSLPHHSRSLAYPQWLSFLLCFHFGYHWEHHEYPYLPWYKLPLARQWSFQQKSFPIPPSRELESVL